MKYMLIMRATDEVDGGVQGASTSTRRSSRWAATTAELIDAGVLVAAEGLTDPKDTIVVDYSSQPPVATDGPYGETKELFNGFWILDVASAQEAVEWSKRAPLGPGMKLEVRRVASIDEFPA